MGRQARIDTIAGLEPKITEERSGKKPHPARRGAKPGGYARPGTGAPKPFGAKPYGGAKPAGFKPRPAGSFQARARAGS